MNRDDALHLIRRTGFAVRESQVSELMALDRLGAINLVTDFGINPPAQPPPGIADPEGSKWRQVRDLRQWWLWRMLTVPRPLQEKLTLFWHSHFATSASGIYFATQTWEQNHLFRLHGLGSYRDLVHSVAVDPAMVIYLDSYRNKTIFGVTRAWDGPEVIDEILLGSKQLTAAKFITHKLWEYFVHESPSDVLVADLANQFIADGLIIGQLIRKILLHDEFWGSQARQAMVRSPIEYVLQCIAGAGSSIDEARPTALENYMYAERATWEWPQHSNLLTLTMLTPEIQVA